MRFCCLASLVLMCATISRAGDVDPLYQYSTREAKGIDAVSWPYCHVKTPGPGMTFTVGIPIRCLADALDPDGYKTEIWNQASEVRFYVDGQLKSTQKTTKGRIDWFEAYLDDVPAGNHVITLQSTNKSGIRNSFPVPIVVTEMPKHAKTITLTEDINLSGNQDLDWQDTTVIGKGFKVHASNFSGKVNIKNSFITGLGEQKSPGINLTTSGAIDIEDSIFDGTGAVFVHTSGNSPITIAHNEFRSNNLIEFDTSNPAKSPVVIAGSSGSGKKLFQGNRIGAGILHFEGPGWLVGGDTTKDSNVLIGPRCVIEMAGRDGICRGNYMHHDYHGGWSQGFNLVGGGGNLLAEHNVIRGSSWVVQDLAGELRYNIIIDEGHNWIRTVLSGSKIHHNIFNNATGSAVNGSTNSGMWMYNKGSDVQFYNNTCDQAGKLMGISSPMLEISAPCNISSVRNNIFTGFMGGGGQRFVALVQRGLNEKEDSNPRVNYADYNCVWNPDAPNVPTYDANIVSGKDPGAHDLKADPQFTRGNILPYPIHEADVWNGKFTVAQVLALYREAYAPKPGSPVLTAGDPADGKNSFIGAIGNGADPNDLFGKWPLTPEKK